MSVALFTEVDRRREAGVSDSHTENVQTRRIMVALGQRSPQVPKVDEQMLSRYHKYLASRVSVPFTAYYPEPTNFFEEDQYRCEVLELLPPSKHIANEFDGLLCRVRKGKYELTLPLIDLEVPQDDLNFELIEDYWYWFWNWR